MIPIYYMLKILFDNSKFAYRMMQFCRTFHRTESEVRSTCVAHCLCGTDVNTVDLIKKCFKVYENFVSEEEETYLITEIDAVIKRRRYENDHWDDAIVGYRETEKMHWSEQNSKVIDRLRMLAFPSNCSHIKSVHILDLSKMGYIKPHVDSVRFCGDTIAGISLLSSCVMRLVMERNKSLIVDVLLPRRSLYIMSGSARYDFTHEVLDDSSSTFKGKRIRRDRRVSIICRNEPSGSC